MNIPEQQLTPAEGVHEIDYPSDGEIISAIFESISGGTGEDGKFGRPSAYGVSQKEWLDIAEESITDTELRSGRFFMFVYSSMAHDEMPEEQSTVAKYIVNETLAQLVAFAKGRIDKAISINATEELKSWGIIQG